MSVFSFAAAAASDIILQPSSQTISPGETFTVDVYVTPDTSISGMQFNLEFDDSRLYVEKVDEKNLFTQSGLSTFFNAGQIENGLLKDVYGCILGSKTISTPAKFATITMIANEQSAGTSTIALKNVIISNPTGNAVEIGIRNTSIEISDFNPYDLNMDAVISSSELNLAFTDFLAGDLSGAELSILIDYWQNGRYEKYEYI